ncbi:hypothetical protein SOVF_085620 [Spinacia oleracea]|nr:hypothetical protein SOVF_085620 [Spinacia oleracea]
MMLMIDGPMITKFIENSEEFDKFANEKFESINNKEEKFSESIALDREEPQNEDDRYQAVDDLEEYKAELKEMMKAVALGIADTPVSVLVEEGSFLSKVFELEIARIKKEKDDEVLRIMEMNRIKISAAKKVDVTLPKKLKKKNSFGIMNFCACSGKQFGEINNSN